MTKTVQLVRDDADGANLYVGAPGEITVDESNQDLRLHDGFTPGGKTIANRDNLAAAFQAKSTELDGLLGFNPQQRGMLTRRGPADYRLRAIGGTAANIGVANGDGYAGAPVVSLLATITSAHTFSAAIAFGSSITVAGGITGTLTGNVTGNITGNVTGNLTGNVLGNVNGNLVGGINTVGKTVVLDDAQITLTNLDSTIGDYIDAAGCPPGSIILWYGALGAIPAGWFLCDGTHGTPNLRDRFVVGAGGSYAVDDTGGATGHTVALAMDPLTTHTHTFTDTGHVLTVAETPAHFHGSGATDRAAVSGSWNANGLMPASTTASLQERSDAGQSQSVTTTVGGGGAHSHSGTTGVGGGVTPSGTATVGVLPPYLALCYIMKGL